MFRHTSNCKAINMNLSDLRNLDLSLANEPDRNASKKLFGLRAGTGMSKC